ncbi:MAG: ATP-binding protein [Xanthobacteraceae bacterium]
MARSLSSLISTQTSNPPIAIVYGVDGVGKTNLAAEFPAPLYLPTSGERPPSDVDMATPGTIESMDDLYGVFGELMGEPHEFKTVIIDSLDGLEPLLNAVTCQRIGASSIDSNDKGSPASFGRGHVESEYEWGVFMDGCQALTEAGMAVVLIAHPEIKRFDSPVTDPYDRYQIKLNKRAAAVVREKSDIVAFLNYRVTLKTKEVAPKKEVTHAEGGKERQIHLVEGAGFVAKNRYSMPDYITYKKGKGYDELAKYFPAPAGVASNDDEPEAQSIAA